MGFALESPVGTLVLRAQHEAIVEIGFGGNFPAGKREGRAEPLLREAVQQLSAYFAGKLKEFDLPLAPEGSAFQRRLWRALCQIPFGETRSYGELAGLLQSAPRAIGGACGRNPIAIVIPCHRVLGKGFALTGYSGGEGLRTKKFLLALEGAWPPASSAAA